ncbi:glycosyltransferase family 2 protein [Winogradskyella aquimaris]|uniref:Glycosyltransferase family 2 protein n=1 Tax=Winogradskyella aquimaris TaxID=864074 RepID=A0ABU5EL69_9FLAO|nr:glycosyltransferase family 2 protein [Winogradskyella aquimaris]MDY2587169.1 glycosyltransferase family 2 protein [Winogradskyella aquimaris]
MTKLLSIITINYNNADGLKKTMDSVRDQSWQEFEHIVIDGNSTDKSLEIIKSYTYKNLNWISEPDTGIYNAMNKGIDRAHGKYLLFLNSGDFLEHKNVLSTVLNFLTLEKSIISGDIIFKKENSQRLRQHPEKMSFSYLIGNAISHPSTFIKQDLFETYGKYDENLKIVSDWAFFLKVLGLNDETYIRLPETITVFDATGISSSEENINLVNKERTQVLKRYFPTIFNNEDDTYIFNKFISNHKRFRYLKIIEEYPFFRKVTTLVLSFFVSIIKLFRFSK